MKNDIMAAIATFRTTFTSKDIAERLDNKYKPGSITKALKTMKLINEVSKGVYKARGRAV
jgi:hypothetical protein